MSQDSFTEITHESWFSRIGGAFKCILVGLVLIVVSFPLLFWNEGRAVLRHKSLKEGAGAVVAVASDRIEPDHAGKLIHVSGTATTEATLTDPVFGVSAQALRLKRVVDMFQWKETSQSTTRKKPGGGTETVTTYSYAKTWADRPIESAKFKEQAGHQNPASFPFAPIEERAREVSLGAFTLSPSLVDRIDTFESLPVGSDTPVPETVRDKVRLHEAGFYMGADPASPQVGDTRIKFKVVRPTEVSVISGQVGNTFEPYRTKAGGTIELLQTGTHPADAMIQKAQASNRMLTWVLRLAGFILMFAGLNMFLRPLSVLADVLPILGNIVGAGTGIIALLVAGGFSLITMAVAWVVYRPLLGIGLIVAATAAAVLIHRRLKAVPSAS